MQESCLQVYREETVAWLGGPLEGLAKNMRTVALAADAEARNAGRKAGALENCGGSLQRVFATAIAGSEMLSPFTMPLAIYVRGQVFGECIQILGLP